MMIKVDEALASSRLDKILVQKIPGLSRSRAKRLIFFGAVKIDSRQGKKGMILKAGDLIDIADSLLYESGDIVSNPEISLGILYEDEAIIMVDKPAGLPCHPIRVEERWTMANALLDIYPDLKGVGFSFLQPGLVNRIDTGTSGIVLVARNNRVFQDIRVMFKKGQVKKGYLALVHGEVRVEGEIDLLIGKRSGRGARVKVLKGIASQKETKFKSKRALTSVRILNRFSGYTLMEILLKTGIRHQIRAHLSFLGHPVVGDTLYGAPQNYESGNLNRFFLHANYMGLWHPITGQWVEVHSPLPEGLREYLARISWL